MALEVKNYMEDCVDYMMVTVLKELKCCMCEHCIHDIKAITLNMLPSKYVVSQRGELYTKIDSFIQQFDVDVIAALTQAAEIVTRSPRHGRE